MVPRAIGLLTVALLGACGRVGFEPVSSELASIELWSTPLLPLATPLAPSFVPGVARYTVGVGLPQASVLVSAIPVEPTTTITIEGIPTPAGERSAAVPLMLGTTPITVVGTGIDGSRSTYTIDVNRAGQLTKDSYIKASNTEAGDGFGYSVAVDGDTLAVASWVEASATTGIDGDQTDNSASGAGAVYVFTRGSAGWTQQAYIKASNTESDDVFGAAIALSGDTLAVGARQEAGGSSGINGNEASNSSFASGAVYVFTRTAGVWSQQAYIKASNSDAFDQFGGYSISLDRDTLAVGSLYESSNATGINGDGSNNLAMQSGAVYVFARTGTTWTQQAYLKASNAETFDHFGVAVALHGETLAVGASGEASNATGVDGNPLDNSAAASGAVYMFERTGTVWAQRTYIKATNTDADDRFGVRVALGDSMLVVAALREDGAGGGIDADGTNNDSMDSGAVYLYARSGSTWVPDAYIKAPFPGPQAAFGAAVAISGDVIVAGVTGDHSAAIGTEGIPGDTSVPSSGAAHVYTRTASGWVQAAYLKASNNRSNQGFGYALDISGSTIVVGAYADRSAATGINGDETDTSAMNAGAVHIFH